MACEKLEMIYFLVVISFMLKYVSTNDTLYVLGNYKTKYDALCICFINILLTALF